MTSVPDKEKSQPTRLPNPNDIIDEIPDAFIDHLFQTYRTEQAAATDDCDQSLKAVAYAMDELEPDEKQKTYQHILTCRPCFDLVSDVRKAEHDARNLGNRDAEVSQEISDAIDEKQQTDSKNDVLSFSSLKAIEYARQWFSTLFTPKFGLVMATACLALFFIVYIFPPTSDVNYDQRFNVSANIALIADTGPSSVRGNTATSGPFELKEGEALRTGDHFQIKINTDKDAYCYLLLADTGTGQTTVLFRSDILADRPKVISEGDKGFRLGVYRGAKTVYMLASEKEIEDFDVKIQELKKGGEELIRSLFPKVSVQMFHFEHK